MTIDCNNNSEPGKIIWLKIIHDESRMTFEVEVSRAWREDWDANTEDFLCFQKAIGRPASSFFMNNEIPDRFNEEGPSPALHVLTQLLCRCTFHSSSTQAYLQALSAARWHSEPSPIGLNFQMLKKFCGHLELLLVGLMPMTE
jgi:hypothetical protein